MLLGRQQGGARGMGHLLLHPAPLAQEAPDYRVVALDHKDLLLLDSSFHMDLGVSEPAHVMRRLGQSWPEDQGTVQQRGIVKGQGVPGPEVAQIPGALGVRVER